MKIVYDFVAIYNKKYPFCPKLYRIYNKVLIRRTNYEVSYLDGKRLVVVYSNVKLEGKIVKLDNLFYTLELTYSSFSETPDPEPVYPPFKSSFNPPFKSGFKRYDLVPL